MSFDLKGALASLAPTIATMLAGPLAGTAVTSLEGALGLSAGSGQDAVTKVVQQGLSPDQIAAVRAADQRHLEMIGQQQLDLKKLNADFATAMAQTDASDRDSARKREIAVQDWTPRILAFGVTLGFFGILIYMMTNTLPSGAHDALLLLLGALQTSWVAIISYYYGSSKSSDRKTELLAQAPAVTPEA